MMGMEETILDRMAFWRHEGLEELLMGAPNRMTLVDYSYLAEASAGTESATYLLTPSMKPSQNSLFKADTYVRPLAESRILGLVHTFSLCSCQTKFTDLIFDRTYACH